MPLRSLATVGLLLLAAAATACSSANDEGNSAAASELLLSSTFQIDSPKFQEKVYPRVRIPKEHTCYGANLSPPLTWTEIPDGTQSFALLAEDVDHHTGIWVLWVLYNIPADVMELPEGVPTSTDTLPDGSIQGANDDKAIGYHGPCPPRNIQSYDNRPSGAVGEGPHRYYFRLYALDSQLTLAPGATKDELLTAIEGRVVARAETVGKYQTAREVSEGGSGYTYGPTPTPKP